jgi:DNA-binding protein HU-beta
MASMTKSDIVNHLSKKLGTTKKLSTQFVDEFVSLAAKEAKKEFVIPGLGKLHVASRKRRKGRNPATGEEIIIPAKKVVKFRVSKAMSDAVFPPKAAPKKKAATKKKKRR